MAATAKEELLSEDSTKKKFGCLYRDLIPAKFCYFTQFYCMGNITLYINLFLLSVGMSVTQAGLINGIRPLFAAVFAFVVGIFVDKTQRKKTVAIILQLVNVAFLIPTPLMFAHFRRAESFKNETYAVNRTLNDVNVKLRSPPFLLVLFWFIVIGSTGMPLITLIDSSIVCLVKDFEGKVSYGMQRIFAPIGFSLGSVITGLVIDMYTPRKNQSNYAIIFFIVSIPVTVLFFSIVSLRMDCRIAFTEEDKNRTRKSFKTSLLQLLKKFEFILLLITLLTAGIAFGLINSYSIILLEEMEQNKSILGFTISLSTISEILIFPFSNYLLKKFYKPFLWFLIAIICYGIRLFVLYLATEIWHVMISQLLHALCHSMLWVSVNEYLYNKSTDEIKETMFSIVNVTFYMIASFIANVFGGILYDNYGGRKLFLGFAIVCCAWSVAMLLYYVQNKDLKIPDKKTSHEEENIMLRARARTFSQISLNI